MPGRLRKLILAEGNKVRDAVRTEQALAIMPPVSVSDKEVPAGARNSCIRGTAELGEGAVLAGCYVGKNAHVRLGPGTVAYACVFMGDVTAGKECTLLGVGVANDNNGGELVCGDWCVLAAVNIGRYKLYGRTGYSLSNVFDNGQLVIGNCCVLLSTVVKLLTKTVTVGDGLVTYGVTLEAGYNDKTSVGIGRMVTMVHGYADIKRPGVMDVPEQPNNGPMNTIGLDNLVSVWRRSIDKYVQLVSHGGTVRIGDNVSIETSVMLHAQRTLDVGDGCMIQPGSPTHAQLRLEGGDITLGKRSLVSVMSNEDERHQDAGGITARGLYGDIRTGYKSRLCITTITRAPDIGLELGDNETGFM